MTSDIRGNVVDFFSLDPDETLFMDGDGMDEAIIGVCYQFGRPPVIAYDREKVLEALVRDGEASWDEAEEHWSYNMVGAWVGDYTPPSSST